EETLVSDPTREILQTIHGLKNEMLFLRRSVWPLREVIATLERAESDLIHENTIIYLRDLYDHTIQVVDTIEMFRDIISGMLDTYLSSISNRMNEVMKVLTIFATIFIPLTFIAGIYGMNFEYMPELAWHWGYPVLWGVMITIGVSMILYFRGRKWF
ncbi:MAG: magnesium/cobalt transporter CorA, partial [Desulfomonilia bacterium]